MAKAAKNGKQSAGATNGAGGAANGASIDKAALTEYISSGRGALSPIVSASVLASSDPNRAALWRTFIGANPAAYNQQVFAKESASVAHGIWYVRDQALYDLLDEMVAKDGTIRSAIAIIEALITKRKADFVADEDDQRAVELRDICRKVFFESESDFGFDALIKTLLAGRIAHGFSVNEIIWGQAMAGDTAVFAPTHFMHRHPGMFMFDSLGNLLFGDDANPERAPLYKFAMLRAAGKYANPFGESAIFPLRFLYAIKKSALQAWVNYADTYGAPIAVGKVPPEAPNRQELIENLNSIFENLTATSGITLGNGEEVEFTPRDKSSSASPHKEIYDYLSREQARILIGGILTMFEPEHASRAQSEVHQETTDWMILPMARELERVINRDIVRPFIALNFGESALEYAPRYEIDTDDPMDFDLTLRMITEAVTKWGLPVAEAEVYNLTGLSAPEEGEPVLKAVPQFTFGEPPRTSIDEGLRIKPDGGVKQDIGTEEPIEMAETRGADRAYQLKISGKTIKIAEALHADIKPLLMDQIRAGAKSGNLVIEFPIESVERALIAAWGLSAMSIQRELDRKKVKSERMAEDDFDIPDLFEPAADWMRSREIMSRAELKDYARALKRANPQVTSEYIEAGLRKQALALARDISDEAGEAVKSVIAKALEIGGQDGFNPGDILSDLLGSDSLPEGLDAYIQNVFRTETANAYAEQRDMQMNDPELEPFIFGIEIFNPSDSRSRESHAALDGLIIQKGSDADLAFQAMGGGPPFSYQCRCSSAPVISAGDDGIEESPDALALVQAIERF